MRKYDFVQMQSLCRGKLRGKERRIGELVVSIVTSGLALHRVMKPFNWSSAAFGRDAENDMFNFDPLQCGEQCDGEQYDCDADGRCNFIDVNLI